MIAEGDPRLDGKRPWHVLRGLASLIVLTALLLACGEGIASTDPEVAQFVTLVNAHRVSRGLPALIWDNRAAAVARAHSRDMRDHRYFSHSWSDGGSTWDRLKARGVTYSQAGENIAWGQKTGRAVLTSWLNSRGHRENIENRSFTHHGVAKVGPYWTHVFFRPRRALSR